MKNFKGLVLGASMLALAVCCAHSTSRATEPTASSGSCPVAGDIDALQKSVDNLGIEMTGITSRVTDKKVAADMLKMQEHLALVSQRLKKMHDSMDGRDGGVMASVPADQAKPEMLKKQ